MVTATLKVFLAHGDPKRLRTAELSNWTGKAICGPRSEFERVLQREEAENSGVYFLTGIEPESNKSAIYIGEAETIRNRLKSHVSKDFWNTVTFFISKDESLTKAHIKYLEGRLIDIAKATERYVVVNSVGSGAKLPESDREDMEIFLQKIQQMLPILGIEAFVDGSASAQDEICEREMLYCNIKGLKASGFLNPNGMIVVKGSEAVLQERASAQNWPSVLTQRNKLIEDGVLSPTEVAYVFTKDVEFSSPSAAAATIHGGSANGLTAWVNNDGVSLKAIQAT